MKKILVLLMSFGVVGSALATKISIEEKTCSVCGRKDKYSVVASYNTFGSTIYLDSRVSGGKKPNHFIKRCEKCNLVGYSIEKPVCDNQNDIVKSSEYQNFFKKGKITYSDEYLAYAFLLEKCNAEDKRIAGAYLDAAWNADDRQDNESAVSCRKKALPYFEKLDGLENRLVLLDIYRRTGDFENARRLASKIGRRGNECHIEDMIEFQKELIKNKDSDNHAVRDNDCKKESKSPKYHWFWSLFK
ncbi:MAG: hypothetical protein LBT45_01210 [Rickettsiales bacterium]|jgi:hypothetical protein|nr:hypothetical protein [Rickettsiales bacterium]